MSFNGSGTFSINSTGQPVVSGTVISDTTFNALTADLATGLTNCITRDGQSPATANIPMGGNKLTGLASGTATTDAATLAQVQSGAVQFFTAGGTVDVITGTLSPSISAYAAGQTFRFVASGANTGAVTLNLNSLGAKAVTKNGTTALAAGDIPSGKVVTVTYDGTQFQLVEKILANVASSGANSDITSLTAVTAISTTAGVDIKGTNTNDSAASGYVGETQSSTASNISAPATTVYGDLASISLDAGDWDVACQGTFVLNGATATFMRIGVSTTSGNSSTGLTSGDTQADGLPTTNVNVGVSIAPKRFSVASTTTVYLKMMATYSAGSPIFYGRISARRVR